MYALDLLTGEPLWRSVVGEPVPEMGAPLRGMREEGLERGVSWHAPVCSVAGGTVWVFYGTKMLALDALTGEIRWLKRGVWPEGYEPVLHGGWLYMLTCLGVEAWGPPPDAHKERAAYRKAQAPEPALEPE